MSTHDRPPGDNVISLFGGAPPATPQHAPPPDPERTGLQSAPAAPPLQDPRQDIGRRTLGRGTVQQGRRGSGVMYNLTHGMAAASVDLARLQEILEGIMAELSVTEMSARWDDDVRETLQDTLLEWVQRVDLFEMEVHESGARVSVQTQDDFGYYQYSFDVFPGRAVD